MAQQYSVEVAVQATGLASVQKLQRAVEGLTNEQNEVSKAASKAANGVRQFDRSAASAGKSANSAVKGVQALNGAIAGITAKIGIVIAAFKGFQAATSAAFDRDVAEKRLKNLTGSTAEYTAALQAAKDASQKFGLTQTEATKALGDTYSRLSGLGFGLKEVTEIYNGFNTVAAKSGVASEDAAGAFLQLSQALGSGKLQGDELRAILERMPQLAQLIAKEMGVTAGEIRKMGADGKISSEIMYNALARAAQGAGDFNGKLTSSQSAQQAFKQATEQLAVAFGQSLLPALTGTVEAMTGIVNAVAGVINGFNQLNTSVQNLANPLRGVTDSLGQIPGLADSVAKAFDDILETTLGLIPGLGQLVKLFKQVGKIKEAFSGGKQGAAELAAETAKVEENARKSLEQFSGMPPKVKESKTAAQQLAASTKAIAAAQKEANDAGQRAVADVNRQLAVKQALLQAEQQINNAKLQSAQADFQAATTADGKIAAAQKIYEITKEQAELEYRAAIQTAEAELLKKRYALDTARVLKKQVETEVALQRSKKIYNEYQNIALQKAAENVVEAQKQLDAQVKINKAVESGAAATRNAQIAAAGIVLEQQKQKVLQDQVTASVNQTADAMGRVASEAQRAASTIQSAASSMGGMAGGMGGGMGGGAGGSGLRPSDSAYESQFRFIGMKKQDASGKIVDKTQEEIEREHNAIRLSGWQGGILKWNQLGASKAATAADALYYNQAGLTSSDAQSYAAHVFQYGGVLGPTGSVQQREFQRMYGGAVIGGPGQNNANTYAEGGYVTGPQQAIVGEGGEPEYIIPESKMSQAMARYGSGQRGDSVIPSSDTVNVNYSGSTVNMGGQEYISKADVPGLLNSAVGQTLKTLRRNSSSRLYAGLDR